MNIRKSIILMVLIMLIPLNYVSAEEKPKEKINENEIIKREDEDKKQNVPKPPNENVTGEEEIVPVEIETPASVTGEKMEGQGTVVDFSTTGERAFYTIVDNENETYYLIIDMDKSENNVYFLSDVNKAEISSMANSTDQKERIIPESQTNEETTDEVSDESTAETALSSKEAPEKEENNNVGFMITVVVIALAGAFAYYFTTKKKKAKEGSETQTEELGDEDDLESYQDDFLGAEDETYDEREGN